MKSKFESNHWVAGSNPAQWMHAELFSADNFEKK